MADVMQVIDGEGVFRKDACEAFFSPSSLGEQRNNYQVVAIMGPQSSGKSTLLNHLFGTTFEMMNAEERRGQTTKGVWMAKSPKLQQPTTLVLDLEGSDSRERGEDDSNFERQTALFALAVADVLLVNLWLSDIGREHASGKPLMKTIMQVNLKLFAPEPNRAKTVLLFVVRDKSVTPIPVLARTLMDDLKQVWDSMTKPDRYKTSAVTDFFHVEVVGLSSAQDKHEDFSADCVVLRRRFTPEAEQSLVVADQSRLPLDALPLSLAKIWEIIHTQRDLNLPAHKVMVANVRCEEIKALQLEAFAGDQAWQGLSAQAAQELVPEFGQTLGGLLDSCIAGYDQEAMYFDAKIREEKRGELVAKLHAMAQGCYQQQLQQLVQQQLEGFEKELQLALAADEHAFAAAAEHCRAAAVQVFEGLLGQVVVPGTPFDGSEGRQLLQQAILARVAELKGAKVSAAMGKVQKCLASKLGGPVINLLEACPHNLWLQLHRLCHDVVSSSTKQLLIDLDGYGLSEGEQEALSDQLRQSAEAKVEAHVREAALTKSSRMKDRFHDAFTMDKARGPRTWQPRDDIPQIAKQARAVAANVLAQLAVIRRPAALEGRGSRRRDPVQLAVARLVQDDVEDASASSNGGSSSRHGEVAHDDTSFDILSAASWPDVDPADVLIEPHEVRTAWREFMTSSNVMVQTALATQQANRMANNRAPPLWAIAAMIFLGWNEFMALLWNPVLLVLGLLVFLFCRTMYVELDVDAELQKGALPGGIALAGKFMPTLQRVKNRTMQNAKQLLLSEEAEGPGRLVQREQREVEMGRRGGAGAEAGRVDVGRDGVGGVQQHPSGPGLSRRRVEGGEQVSEH